MFYDQFKALCDSKKLKPYVVIKEINPSGSATVIEQWKKGSTPRQETLNKIAEYFGVSIDYLLNGKEKQPAENGKLSDRLEKIMEYSKRLTEEQQDFLITQLSAFQQNQ